MNGHDERGILAYGPQDEWEAAQAGDIDYYNADNPASPSYWAALFVTAHPELAQAASRALTLVEDGCVDGHTVTSTSGNTYHVTHAPNGALQCTCAAYYYNPVRVGTSGGPRDHCKHTLAVLIAFGGACAIAKGAAVQPVEPSTWAAAFAEDRVP